MTTNIEDLKSSTIESVRFAFYDYFAPIVNLSRFVKSLVRSPTLIEKEVVYLHAIRKLQLQQQVELRKVTNAFSETKKELDRLNEELKKASLQFDEIAQHIQQKPDTASSTRVATESTASEITNDLKAFFEAYYAKQLEGVGKPGLKEKARFAQNVQHVKIKHYRNKGTSLEPLARVHYHLLGDDT